MSASLGKTFQLMREAVAAPKRVTTDLGPGGRMSTQGKKISPTQMVEPLNLALTEYTPLTTLRTYASTGSMPPHQSQQTTGS